MDVAITGLRPVPVTDLVVLTALYRLLTPSERRSPLREGPVP